MPPALRAELSHAAGQYLTEKWPVLHYGEVPRYAPGQKVLVTGCGLSETQDGGYAEYARVPGEAVIPLPAGMSELDSMKLGTAGFTAALAVHRMEQNGQAPANGPVVVTGATGGVGSIAMGSVKANIGHLKAAAGAAGVRHQRVTLDHDRKLELGLLVGAVVGVAVVLAHRRAHAVLVQLGAPAAADQPAGEHGGTNT